MGGLTIENPAEKAAHVVYNSDNDVAEFIWFQALERNKAMQVAAHSLDQRSTQVATLQFAAAAFAAAGAINSTMWPLFACAILFLIGGLCAFRGIRSDEIQLPGVAPSWWWQDDESISKLTIEEAKAWSAKLMQESIDQIDIENSKRAKLLNLSLVFAFSSSSILILLSFIWMFVK